MILCIVHWSPDSRRCSQQHTFDQGQTPGLRCPEGRRLAVSDNPSTSPLPRCALSTIDRLKSWKMYQDQMSLLIKDEFETLVTAHSIDRALRTVGRSKKKSHAVLHNKIAEFKDFLRPLSGRIPFLPIRHSPSMSPHVTAGWPLRTA